MYEFVSVSASSYDPAALAAKLNDKSAEGWEVVAIVPTGGDVTAFCRRSADAQSPGAAAPTTGSGSVVDQPTLLDTEGRPNAAASVGSVDTTAVLADEAPASSGDPLYSGAREAADREPATMSGATAAPEPTEPAGWGAAPAESPRPSGSDSTPSSEPPPSYEPEPTYEPTIGRSGSSAASGAGATVIFTPDDSQTPAQDRAPDAAYAPATQQQPVTPPAAPPPSTPSVPAGWYADPSGRFELRYWDSAQWTEHVARGGAQFTDPPVA